MGGEGSGRRPDPVKQLTQQRTPIADVGEGLFLPNHSGMSKHHEAEKIFPTGGIIMWSGNIASIPTGWALCNGANGTPDLRDRFVVGAKQDEAGIAKTNISGILEQTGGYVSHFHDSTNEGPFAYGQDAPALATNPSAGNIPPFFALAFIMKL